MIRAAALPLAVAVLAAGGAPAFAAPGQTGADAQAAAKRRAPLRVAVLTKTQSQAARSGSLRVRIRLRARRAATVRLRVTTGRGTAVTRSRRVRVEKRRLRTVKLRLTPNARRTLPGCFGRTVTARARTVGRRRVRRARAARLLGGDPAACGTVTGDVTRWGYDLLGGRHNPAERTIGPGNAGRLELKWAFAFPGADAHSSQPAVVGDTLYVGGRNGIFYALDRRTGRERWRFDTVAVTGPTPPPLSPQGPRTRGNPLRNGPSVVGGVVYFGDFKANFYALDAATGRLLWVRKVDDHPYAIITGSPLVWRDRVYIGVSSEEIFTAASPTYPCCTFRGGLVALDRHSGRVDWRWRGLPEPAKPIGRNTTGAQRYAPAGVPVWSTPAVDPDTRTVFFGTGPAYSGEADKSDSIVALDAGSGREKWFNQFTKGDTWNGACYFPAPLGNCPDPGPDFDFGSSPNVFRIGNRTVVGEGQKSGVYHLVDAATGKVIWQTLLNAAATGEGGVAGQQGIQWGSSYDGRRLYVATNDAQPGRLFALDPATGRILWTRDNPADGCLKGLAAAEPDGCTRAMPAAVTSTPGVVWEGSRDAKMRAFAASDGRLLWEYETGRTFSTVNGEVGRGGSIAHGGATVAHGMVYVGAGYQTADQRASGVRGNVLLAFGLP